MSGFSLGFISRHASLGRVVVCNILRHQRCLFNAVISNNNNNRMTGVVRSYPSVQCSWRLFHTSCWTAAKLSHKPRDHLIKANEIFLIDEKGATVGKIRLRKALILGKEKNLHVVQIQDRMKDENIPLCKLMSIEAINADAPNIPQRKNSGPPVKRRIVKFSSEITDHDISHKVKSMVKSLDSGHHITITVSSNNPRKASHEDRVAMFNKIVNLVTEHGTFDGKMRSLKGQVFGSIKPVEKPN